MTSKHCPVAAKLSLRTTPGLTLEQTFKSALNVNRLLAPPLRLSEPRLSEAERQACEAQWADRSLFVTELLLSTLLPDEDTSASSDEDEDDCHGSLRNFADFEAMGCVEVMTLDVALENLNLTETSPAPKKTKPTAKTAPTKKEPPAPPL